MNDINCCTGSDAGPQSLSDVIEKKYDGNQSEFARDYGVDRQQVRQWAMAKKPVFVLSDGRLIQIIREPVAESKK